VLQPESKCLFIKGVKLKVKVKGKGRIFI